jgi:hypothetical protein
MLDGNDDGHWPGLSVTTMSGVVLSSAGKWIFAKTKLGMSNSWKGQKLKATFTSMASAFCTALLPPGVDNELQVRLLEQA